MNEETRLRATIGLPQAVALYIGAVLGSGVLLVPGLAATVAGPASLVAWGVMTLLVLPMALVMGLLAAKFPNAGGVSHFVTMAFGGRAGALVGWLFLMSVPIAAPVAAVTGAGYLTAAVGGGTRSILVVAVTILMAGLLTNAFGMKLAGKVQVAVVTTNIAVLLLGVLGSVPAMHETNFAPFMPYGWTSVGRAVAIIFWCFVGWEAVSHLSEEFINPSREAIKGVTIAAIIVGILYFLTALFAVGTHRYGLGQSSAAMVLGVKRILGFPGAFVAGSAGVFICTAGVIAYVGAASRLAYSLANNGRAPRFLSAVSQKRGTPIGGIYVLTVLFVIVLALYFTGTASLTSLIQLSNATFILTYLGGCAAGVRLLRNRLARIVSWVSVVLTTGIFLFVGWGMLYPVFIVIVILAAARLRRKN